MPSKTRLAPPSAHTRRRAALERKTNAHGSVSQSDRQTRRAESQKPIKRSGRRQAMARGGGAGEGEGEGRHRGTRGAARSGGGAG
jgi:hypothetical protein